MSRAATILALQAEAPGTDGAQQVHLLPAGRFAGIDGRGPYQAVDLNGIVEASRRASGHRQMVIDYNHETDKSAAKNGGQAPAAGWITGLQARDDGIWGLVEWTPKAAEHIANREYRYVSPVIRHDAEGRVTHLLRASLVNTPNFDQLTALNSAEDDDEMDLLTKLRDLLKMDANAGEDAVMTELSGRLSSTHSAQPDPTKFVPIGLFERAIAEGNKLRQGISKQAAEDHVDGLVKKGVLLPWMRDWSVSLCSSNMPMFDEFVKKVGPGFSYLTNDSGARLTPPLGSDSLHSEGDDPLHAEVAAQLGLDPKKFAEFRATQSSKG